MPLRLFLAGLLLAAALLPAGCGKQNETSAAVPATPADKIATTTEPATTTSTKSKPAKQVPPAALPADIRWETNNDEPPIGDPAALKGGTFVTYDFDYPLTFRLVGPNSNDTFAAWNRSYTMDFVLVNRHPITDHYIPWMATHWAARDDHKTVYFKLDPAARWSDGRPVTADDYVFTFEMMGSQAIVDPFYNEYRANYFENVEAVDRYTLRITGKRPSWRPLDDYNLWATPRHATKLGPNWVKEANNTPQVVPGPYVVTQAEPGKKVVFEKVKNWWGENCGRFKGMFNPGRIVLRIIPEDRELDYFKNGELDQVQIRTARIWAERMDFPAVRNGWVRQKRIFVDMPAPTYGFAMNLEVPIFQNKEFRKALQYLFNFDAINDNLMYRAYYRIVSAFQGTEYANPDLVPYGFNPVKARQHLNAAGYTRRDRDGWLIDDKGRPARFTLLYDSKGLEPHLIVAQQYYKHFGIDMRLKLLDAATAFNRGLERKYEMTIMSRVGGFYPEPHQFFHSDFVKVAKNNDIWAYGRADTDKLIDIYRFDMAKPARLDAMRRLDSILQDEAFYIPFWNAPYINMLYWDKVCWPPYIFPKRTQQITDWQVFWIDPAKEKALNAAMAAGKPLAPDPLVDVDAWGVKAALEAKDAAAKAEAEKTAKAAPGGNAANAAQAGKK